MKPSLYELLVNEAGLKPSAAHCIEEAFREIINEEVEEAAQESAGIEGRIRDCIREEIRLLETRLKSETDNIISKVRHEVRMGELDKAMDAFSKPAAQTTPAASAPTTNAPSMFSVRGMWKGYREGRKKNFWHPFESGREVFDIVTSGLLFAVFIWIITGGVSGGAFVLSKLLSK